MTVLTDIVENLRSYLTLKTEQFNVWLSYLRDEELDYVNGGVYLVEDTPTYHIQRSYSDAFEVDHSLLECNLFFKGGVSEKQMDDAIVEINGSPCTFYGSIGHLNNQDYAIFLIANVSTGYLRISLPSLNDYDDFYQGMDFGRYLSKQTISYDISPYIEGNKIKGRIKCVEGFVNGQEGNCYTILSNGNVGSKQMVMFNNNTQFRYEFELDYIASVSKVCFELKPKTITNITHTGGYLEVNL